MRNDIAFFQFCVSAVGANCVRPRETAGLPYEISLRRLHHRRLRGVQHILNKNAVSRGGIVDEDVGDSTHDLAVLNERRAAHECGQ